MSEKLSLTTAARTAVVSAFTSALESNDNNASLVTQVCNTVIRYTKGEEIADADTQQIIAGIAKQRGWRGDAVKTRGSEVRTILRACSVLPETIEAMRAKTGVCNWHTAIKLARRINKGAKPTQAVRLVTSEGDQSPKSTPHGRAAGALKAWFKVAKRDKREAILKAASLLGLTLGVKPDA